MSLMGMTTKTVDEESGEACYAKDTLAIVHENLTHTSSMEMSGGFGAMSDTLRADRAPMTMETQTMIVMALKTSGTNARVLQLARSRLGRLF